jgi:hypothetical protein
MKKTGLGSVLAALAMFSLAGTSSASICSLSDVTLGGFSANDCGSGPMGDSIANTPVNDPQLPNDYMDWDVNVYGDGDRSDWQFYYKQDLNNDGTTTADFSLGAGGIDLQITSLGGNDAWDTGTFTVNAQNPLLIVLGDGAAYEYTWYLFTGYTGPQSGTWDTSSVFGGMDLSNITAYTVVPVPAAVWLFGSGLLGLVGVARRKRA